MRSDVARSIALVMLMIVSVQMPMFDNAEEPVELKEEPVLEMAPANPLSLIHISEPTRPY